MKNLYTLSLVATMFLLSCKAKKHEQFTNKKETNCLYQSSDNSSITIAKEVDTFSKGYHLNFETKNTNYVWKKYKNFSKSGWFYFYSLIKEQSCQRFLDSDRPTNGKIVLKAFCPNSNPVSDTFNFNQNTWSDTVIASKVEYTSEFIKSVLYRENAPRINTLMDYYTGKPQINYSSKLFGLEKPAQFDYFVIGYLEQPDFENEKFLKTGLYGILTIFSPITRKTIKIKIFRDFDYANKLNYYKNLHFKQLVIKGNTIKNETDNLLHDLEFLDKRVFLNIDDFKIEIHFEGIKDILLTFPIKNKSLSVTELRSKEFTFEVETTE